uniref:Nudix hydrolase domain-containing protein n=1 Tax=viral metagenome TaxID=1070528 RepID=A0A6C0HJM1_9ZZZZ
MKGYTPIKNVFEKGLIRGAAHLPHDPEKAYAYVEHPTEGWRVYLRSCMFLHPSNESFNPMRFLVVKDTHRRGAAWEPPKGQMERKELRSGTILECLAANALRETEEEAHIRTVKKVRHTGLVLQSQESSYPNNHYFQYHIFQGEVDPEEIEHGLKQLKKVKTSSSEVARWKRDRKEKDEMTWFHPRNTRLKQRWSIDLVAMYMKRMSA